MCMTAICICVYISPFYFVPTMPSYLKLYLGQSSYSEATCCISEFTKCFLCVLKLASISRNLADHTYLWGNLEIQTQA